MRDLPSKRFYNGSVAIGQNAFIVAGFFNNTIDKYDKNTNTLQTVNTIHKTSNHFGICTIKSVILISGGYDGSNYLKTCFLYKPISNNFEPIAIMNVENRGHALVNMNNKFVFSIGGLNHQDGYLNSIEKYDPDTNKWTIVDQKLNIARSFHQAVTYKHCIYIIGGETRGHNVVDSIEKINTIEGTTSIIKTKLKMARKSFALAKINEKAYIIGGSNVNFNETDTVEIFDMENETITDGISIPFADYSFSACVL